VRPALSDPTSGEDPWFAEWNRHVAELVCCVDDPERLPAALFRSMESISPTSLSYLGVYRQRRSPTMVWSRPEGAQPTDWGYALGLFELDPFYLALKKGRLGCLPLHEIAPPGFEGSEYYYRHYASRNIKDELVHAARLPGGGGVIGIGGLPEHEKTFTAAEIARHKVISPVLCAFSLRAAEIALDKNRIRVDSPEDIDSALEQFGVDVLTNREQEVIHLVLRGHNSESVAHQLGVMLDTVKRHRMHAYAKLRVGSQGELFSLFLKSIGLKHKV
jgi:DNA-binding CsgD family transcriptional regulator